MQRNELEIPRVPAGHRFTETLALGFAASCIAQRGARDAGLRGAATHRDWLCLMGQVALRLAGASSHRLSWQTCRCWESHLPSPLDAGAKPTSYSGPQCRPSQGPGEGPPVLYGSLKDPRSTYRPERSDQDPSVHIVAPAGSPMSDAPGRAVLPLLSEAEERLRLCAWSVRLWERRSDAAAKHVSSAVK